MAFLAWNQQSSKNCITYAWQMPPSPQPPLTLGAESRGSTAVPPQRVGGATPQGGGSTCHGVDCTVGQASHPRRMMTHRIHHLWPTKFSAAIAAAVLRAAGAAAGASAGAAPIWCAMNAVIGRLVCFHAFSVHLCELRLRTDKLQLGHSNTAKATTASGRRQQR